MRTFIRLKPQKHHSSNITKCEVQSSYCSGEEYNKSNKLAASVKSSSRLKKVFGIFQECKLISTKLTIVVELTGNTVTDQPFKIKGGVCTI